MTLQKAIKISLVVHLLPFFMTFGFPTGCSRGGGDSDKKSEKQAQHKHEKQEEIVDKPADQPTEIALIEETAEQVEQRIEKAARKDIAECEPHFGGIGIAFSGYDGRIGKSFKYYPGSDAGLQVGDKIVSPDLDQIKGEIGTPVDISYLRDGVIHKVTIMRGRICTKDM